MKDFDEEFVIELLVKALHLDASDSAQVELGAHGLVGFELGFHMYLIPENLFGFFGGRPPGCGIVFDFRLERWGRSQKVITIFVVSVEDL